jgi:hypothetical protein
MGAMVFVPEGQHDRSQARSAWNHEENRPVPAGRLNRSRLRWDRQRLQPSLRDGTLFASVHRHFVPGYDQPVPPGQSHSPIERPVATPGYAPGSSGRRAGVNHMRKPVGESVVGQGNKASQTVLNFAPFNPGKPWAKLSWPLWPFRGKRGRFAYPWAVAGWLCSGWITLNSNFSTAPCTSRVSPALILPRKSSSARGSSRNFSTARRIGRAP